MQSRILLVLALFFFPMASHAATFTGANLPGAGETLTITEDSQFIISKSEAAVWGGTISVGAGFKLDFFNQGSIQGTCYVKNESSTFNFVNDGYLGNADINITNNAGQFNFQNNGSVGVGFNVTNVGWGTVNFQNNGAIDKTLNFNTYGANTNIQNSGFFSGTLNVLDQYDKTYINNNGEISHGTLNLTANGDMGMIQIQNNGLITDSVSNNSSNYGGSIIFDNAGTADFAGLHVSAYGSSHGVVSSFLMLYSRNVNANELNVNGQLRDTSFFAAGLDMAFDYDQTSGSYRAVFNDVNGVPEPATVLLLGLGLMGVLGIRRKMQK